MALIASLDGPAAQAARVRREIVAVARTNEVAREGQGRRMSEGGLLHLRAAYQYAVKLEPYWGQRSEDWFRRWLRACSLTEERLVVRLTPGKTAPVYVRKSELKRILDAADTGPLAEIEALKSRVQSLEEDMSQMRRRVGLPVRKDP
jgi:hypothetical protein